MTSLNNSIVNTKKTSCVVVGVEACESPIKSKYCSRSDSFANFQGTPQHVQSVTEVGALHRVRAQTTRNRPTPQAATRFRQAGGAQTSRSRHDEPSHQTPDPMHTSAVSAARISTAMEAKSRSWAQSAKVANKRPRRISFGVVQIIEFKCVTHEGASIPKSGGPGLTLGKPVGPCETFKLSEFEKLRCNRRMPRERFHIEGTKCIFFVWDSLKPVTGRLSSIERERMIRS